MSNRKNEETTIGGDTAATSKSSDSVAAAAARTTPVPSLTMKMLHKWVAEMLVPYKLHTSCAKSYILRYRDVDGDVVNLVSDMDIVNALQNGRPTNSRTVEIKLQWIGEIMTKEEFWKSYCRCCHQLILVLVLLFLLHAYTFIYS